MIGLWLVFMLMLFVLEPLFLHRRWETAARDDGAGRTFDRVQRMHRILFVLSLLVVFVGTGGAHGLF